MRRTRDTNFNKNFNIVSMPGQNDADIVIAVVVALVVSTIIFHCYMPLISHRAKWFGNSCLSHASHSIFIQTQQKKNKKEKKEKEKRAFAVDGGTQFFPRMKTLISRDVFIRSNIAVIISRIHFEAKYNFQFFFTRNFFICNCMKAKKENAICFTQKEKNY